MDEQKKYEVIKHLADHPDASKGRAALTLGCTRRHINRMLDGYKKEEKAFFVHGNRGRQPATTIPPETRRLVVGLYLTKYDGANFQHFTELLEKEEGIKLSRSSVASILEKEYILPPRATKAKKKKTRKELEQAKKQVKTKKEADSIQTNLVSLEDAHPRRPRCAYFGELEQLDASSFEWIPGHIWHLHLAIDDAKGCITGAWFDTQETLNAYYHVFQQILRDYGIPYKFLTDRRTIFTYQKKNSPSIDEDTYTQFAYACKQLGVQLESTSVPQTKGRVERLNQTLQSRLPVELRLAGVTTIDAANEFLNSYIKEFNAKFALPFKDSRSVFEVQPEPEKINLILAVLTERMVDSGHSIQFRNNYYSMVDKQGSKVCYRKGTKVLVIKAFDGSLFCCANDNAVYALEQIPLRAEKSKELDPDVQPPKTKKRYIPPMNHPWRRAAFGNFVRKQAHHSGVAN